MTEQNVVVTDIRMPFLSMVAFMFKWALASIPAFILLVMVGTMASACVAGLSAV